MKIELRDERPPATAERLAEVADRVAAMGHPIPSSYRAFLEAQDGGVPVRDEFSFQERGRKQHDGVQVFIGVEPSPDGDLVEHVQAYSGRIPPGMLPFADDGFGNVLLLDARDEADGPVWFWDHELETDPPDESNLSWVATDLQSFLESLTEGPERPPAPEPRKGLRRLFSRS